ncbi:MULTISPECIES: serine hydrolase [unclassified Streptomyces]|uniref:serine hydrolase n=1 Tax=unclassified Streptomyces TaxID=2593676 RepID=UPI0004C0DF8B|nr:MULTISPECIES: serine hydrolase [unclassified Streptomyces]
MESRRASRRRARPSRRRPLLVVLLVTAAVAGATAAGTVYVRGQAHGGDHAVSSPSTAASGAGSDAASASGSGEASVEPATDPSVDRGEALAAAMKGVALPDGARVSVAVLDVDSGEHAAYGDAAFDTASIVKVDILAALLLQAQDADRSLTAQEKTYATAMIENSDNTSASALWDTIGRADGLDAANKRFGLTATQGGDGPLWGLTQTTSADQLLLLQQVFGEGGAAADPLLDEASRSYLQGLMGNVETDQSWGVSAAAGSASAAYALKNGWLARSTTGLWDVNSVGRITAAGGDHCLVAVLSEGHATQAKGIAVVEAAARAAVGVLSGAS